jgi:periplasmic protein TonB
MRCGWALLLGAACAGAPSEANAPAAPTVEVTPTAEVPEAQPTPEILVRAPEGEPRTDEPHPTDDPQPPDGDVYGSVAHPADDLPAGPVDFSDPDDPGMSNGPVQGQATPYRRPGVAAAPNITPARIRGSFSCSFPPNTDSIDEAIVSVEVLVGADGIARQATVLQDPGHGFGRAAKACVLQQSYDPARDPAATPVEAKLRLRVRFVR